MPQRAFLALARAVLWGAWSQNPGRLSLTVVAIALGVALATTVHLVNHSAATEFSSALRELSGSADVIVRGPRSGFDEMLYPRLAQREGIAVASPILEIDTKLIEPRGTLRILGIDAFRALALQPGLLGDAQAHLLELLAPDTVMLSLPAAQALGLREGDVLRAQTGLETVALRVVAVLPLNDALRQPLALMDIGSAQWKLDQLGKLSRIELRLHPGTALDATVDALNAALPAGVTAVAADLAAEQSIALSRAYRVNLNMLALVALFTGAVLVYSTQALAVLRRRTHFALLRALGLPVGSLQALVLVEAAVVGASGTALGLCVGVVCAQLAVAHLGADLGAGFFSGIDARLRIDALGLVAIAACGLGASVLGGLAPARDASRTAPAAALRSGSEQTQGLRPRLLPAAALLVLGGALTLLPAVDGLPLFGYAAVACLLFAALLLMPAYARYALRRIPLPGVAALRLALQQMRDAPRYASMSLAPILAAISLTVAMLIMIVSFRQSLDTWLQIVLPADLYARAGSAYSAWLDAAMQERLRAAPAVERVAFSRYDAVVLDPQRPPVTLIARDLDPQRPEGVQWAAPPRPPEPGATPVWVSEAARALFGLEIGQQLRIPVGSTPIEVTVAGVWRDYLRQNGAILLPRAAFLAAGGDDRANEAWVWLRSGADPARAGAELRRSLRLGPELELREPRLLRELSLAAFDRTFAVTYALQLIAVLIGLFGISVGASAEAIARRRELGMLHHLGMDRRQLGVSLACEGGLIGALGALAGVIAGGVMSFVLVHVINKQSFHWSMELHVPWLALLLLAAAAATCATATAGLSVRRALGSDIVQAVREDW